MKPEQATRWITKARFEPYLADAEGDHELAVALYVWNARVSAAMFETLHHVEVTLRNAIDAQFEPMLGSGDRAQVAGLMSKLVPFRNRLAHHETIIRRPLAEHYDEMLELAGLIDPEARSWINSASRVRASLADRPKSGPTVRRRSPA